MSFSRERVGRRAQGCGLGGVEDGVHVREGLQGSMGVHT